MGLNVIVLGATGMVGEGVLHVALGSDAVSSVLVLGRRACGVRHAKLREIVHGDLHDLGPIGGSLSGYDACFFCLGTTSIGKGVEEYRHTTYDLTMHVATTLCRQNPGMTMCYVSGAGTDSSESGRLAWARIKGKTENDLKKLPFKAVYNFRPGMIKPIKGLHNAFPGAGLIGWAYPLLHALFPRGVCTLEDLGRAMIQVSSSGYDTTTLENTDIASAAHLSREGPQS